MVNWKEYGNPFLNFTEETTWEWIDLGFNKDGCKEWLDIGMKSSDSNYCWWLKNEVKETPENILNYGWDKDLREQYQEYTSDLVGNNLNSLHEVLTLLEKVRQSEEEITSKNDLKHIKYFLVINKVQNTIAYRIANKDGLVDKTIDKLRKGFEKRNSENNDKILDFGGLQVTRLGHWRWLEYERQNNPEWLLEWLKESLNNYNCLVVANLKVSNEKFIEKDKRYLRYFQNQKERYLEYIEKTLINSGKPLTLQEWLNVNYPTKEEKEQVEEIRVDSKDSFRNADIEGGKLDLSEYSNLKRITIIGRILSNFTSMNSWPESLKTPITKLILGNNQRLERLVCNWSQLNDLDFLKDLDSEKLKRIDISYSNISSDLTPFSRFVNLEDLCLWDNPFYGSLQPLKNLTKLKILGISHTNVDGGLEYLPESVEILICYSSKKDKVQKIRDLLANERGIVEENMLGITNFPQKLKDIKEGKVPVDRKEKGNIELAIPPLTIKSGIKSLFKEKNEKDYESQESYELAEVIEKYESIELKRRGFDFFNIRRAGSGSEQYIKIKNTINNNNNSLPIRLVDLSKEIKVDDLKVIEVEELKKIKTSWRNLIQEVRGLLETSKICSFAMLSYVWGKKEEGKDLSLGGKKSFHKAIKALEFINKEKEQEIEEQCRSVKDLERFKKEIGNINFLWMDQLCINQKNTEESLKERNQEVPKMARYYDESTLTLISINFKIKDWIKSRNCKDDKEKAEEIMRKIVKSEWFSRTWTFQEGWLSKQTIFMFDDCLVDGREIAEAFVRFASHSFGKNPKNWEENHSCITFFGLNYWTQIDGTKVNIPNSLPFLLEIIKNRKRSIPVDGIYSLLGLLPYGDQVKVKYKPWGEKYTKEELEERLLGVMKVGIENGFYEPLSWKGMRRREPWRWWIPEMDENGCSVIASSIPTFISSPYKNIEFTKNGIKLLGSRHIVSSWQNISDDPNFVPFADDIHYKLEVENGNVINLSAIMSLTRMSESIKKGDVLIIPDAKQQKDAIYTCETFLSSDKSFVFLVSNSNNVSLSVIDLSISKKLEKKEIFIDMINYRVIQSESRLTEEAEEQIERILDMQKVLTEVSIINSSQEDIKFVKEQLETAKGETEKYLTSEEIEHLCQEEKNLVEKELIAQTEIPPKS